MSLLLKLPTEVLNEVTRSIPADVLLRLRLTCTELHALNFPNASAILGHHFMTLRNEQSQLVAELQETGLEMAQQLESAESELEASMSMEQFYRREVGCNQKFFSVIIGLVLVTAAVVIVVMYATYHGF